MIEPETFLALATIRLVEDGQAVPTHPLLKPYKKGIAEAVKKGWIDEASRSEQITDKKTGKAKKKSVKFFRVTPAGVEAVRSAATPAEQAAMEAASLATLKADIAQDGARFREELAAQLGPGKESRAKEAVSKDLAKVRTGLDQAVKLLEKIESLLDPAPDQGLANRVQEAIAKLETRVDAALARVGRGTPSSAQVSGASSQPHPGSDDGLPQVLRASYDELCRYIEFKDGMVEIPRLYHEARRREPALQIPAFHAALLDLSSRGQLHLHVCNDPASISEPDKAIRKEGKLYYFVYWRTR